MAKLTLKIKVAWWFTYIYLPVTTYMYHLIVNYIDIDYEPDFDKIEYWLSKATTFEVI